MLKVLEWFFIVASIHPLEHVGIAAVSDPSHSKVI